MSDDRPADFEERMALWHRAQAQQAAHRERLSQQDVENNLRVFAYKFRKEHPDDPEAEQLIDVATDAPCD